MSFELPQTDVGLTEEITALLVGAGFTVIAKEQKGTPPHFVLYFKDAEEVLYRVEVNQGDFTTVIALELDGNDGNGLTIVEPRGTEVTMTVTMDGDTVVFSSPQASSSNPTCRCAPDEVPATGNCTIWVECTPHQIKRTILITPI